MIFLRLIANLTKQLLQLALMEIGHKFLLILRTDVGFINGLFMYTGCIRLSYRTMRYAAFWLALPNHAHGYEQKVRHCQETWEGGKSLE